MSNDNMKKIQKWNPAIKNNKISSQYVTNLGKKKIELLWEMSDSRTGTVKVQDELKYVITPESKEIFIKKWWGPVKRR